jgi:fatty acid desaturase
MSTTAVDYSLTGESADAAETRGLANAEWFLPEIDGATLRALQTRTDRRAGLEVGLWVVLLIGAGVWAWTTVWSWWSIPAFAIYGALYGGSADPRWHECGHGTAFKSRRVNDFIYPIASFMLFRGPTVWRWSHYRHHTDTIIVGRDAEIVFQRPCRRTSTARSSGSRASWSRSWPAPRCGVSWRGRRYRSSSSAARRSTARG